MHTTVALWVDFAVNLWTNFGFCRKHLFDVKKISPGKFVATVERLLPHWCSLSTSLMRNAVPEWNIIIHFPWLDAFSNVSQRGQMKFKAAIKLLLPCNSKRNFIIGCNENYLLNQRDKNSNLCNFINNLARLFVSCIVLYGVFFRVEITPRWVRIE